MRVLRVIVYAFAFVSCKVAFHVARVCRLHVCFAFVVSGLLVCACMLVWRSLVYGAWLRFILYVCILRV